MDDRRLDAAVAEVVAGLIQVRRVLDPDTFLDLVGSLLVEIEQGVEVALERELRRKPQGNVVPFPGPASRIGTEGDR